MHQEKKPKNQKRIQDEPREEDEKFGGSGNKKVKTRTPLTGRGPLSLKNQVWKMLADEFDFPQEKRREFQRKLDKVLKPFEEKEQKLRAQIEEMEKRHYLDIKEKDKEIKELRNELGRVQDQLKQLYKELMEQAKKYEEESLKREAEHMLNIQEVKEGVAQQLQEVWKAIKSQDCKQEAQALSAQLVSSS